VCERESRGCPRRASSRLAALVTPEEAIEKEQKYMRTITKTVKAMFIYIFSLLLMAGMPLSVFAATTPASTTTTPTATTTQTKDKTKTTTTPTTTTPPSTTYTYDAATGHWNTSKWYYDAQTGTYQPVVTQSTTVAPASTTTPTTPTVITPQTSNSTTASGQQTSTTGTNDTNQTTATTTDGATATTGNATVAENTTGGNATTGNAASTATILNTVNSTLSTPNNQAVASFVTNVMGDVNGDILLQPMILKAELEAGTPTSSAATVTNTNNLTNNVNLSATSGNAGVVGNTTGGNATSGTANTVANVVNIINSFVSANQSFVGTINIYGNLNGDILIAPDFISQLIASNGGATADATQTADPTTTTLSSTDMQNIVNNVSLAAQSGKAAVMDNTTAGNATSGSANTNVVLFNLTGHQIVASNSLLVFVNVLGKWVGVIVDAPVGATAAAIGNGVTSDTTVQPNLSIVSDNNDQVTNNINLASTSGNATVAANTLAGNAVSGNATSSANIANISNDQFGLTGWFGVLFINVFGNWIGSFGINTSAGNPLVNQSPSGSSSHKVIEFIPKTASQYAPNLTLVSSNNNNGYSASTTSSGTNVATDSTSKDPSKQLPAALSTSENLPGGGVSIPLVLGSSFLIAISAAGIRRSILVGKPGSIA